MSSNLNLIEELKYLWDTCERKNADVFRYQVNVTRDKVLEKGNFKFYIQVSHSGSAFDSLMNETNDVMTENVILAQH